MQKNNSKTISGKANPCRRCNHPYAHFEYIMPISKKSIALCDTCYVKLGCHELPGRFYASQNDNLLHLHLIKEHERLMRIIEESDVPKHFMHS